MKKINITFAEDMPRNIVVRTQLAYEMQPVATPVIDQVPGR